MSQMMALVYGEPDRLSAFITRYKLHPHEHYGDVLEAVRGYSETSEGEAFEYEIPTWWRLTASGVKILHVLHFVFKRSDFFPELRQMFGALILDAQDMGVHVEVLELSVTEDSTTANKLHTEGDFGFLYVRAFIETTISMFERKPLNVRDAD